MTETPLLNEPKGIGGWLILVALGLVFAPLRQLVLVVTTFPPIFRDGVWEVLTTPGTEAYHPLWAPLLIYEMAGNTLFIFAGVILAVLFFRHSRRFPKLYIVLLLANLVFLLLDALLGSVVITNEPMFDPETAREVGRGLVGAMIWVPYMLVSKRVRNTFVK